VQAHCKNFVFKVQAFGGFFWGGLRGNWGIVFVFYSFLTGQGEEINPKKGLFLLYRLG